MKFLLMALLILSLVFPVAAQLPESLQPITPENADKLVEIMRLGRGQIREVTWSPDGTSMAVASATGVYVYDNFESEPRSLQDIGVWMESIAYSTDGTQLVSGGLDGKVYVWDINSGEILQILEEHTGVVTKVGFSVDGEWIVSGGDEADSTLKLWDIETGELIFEHIDNKGTVESLDFSTDGNYLAWVSTPFSDTPMSEAWLLDLQTLAVVQLLLPEIYPRLSPGNIAFNEDNSLLVFASWYEMGMIWDVETRQMLPPPANIPEHAMLVMTPEGIFAVERLSFELYDLWDFLSGEYVGQLEGYNYERFFDAVYSPQVLATVDNYRARIHIWDTQTYSELMVLDHFTPPITFLEMNAGGDKLISMYSQMFSTPAVYFLDVWDIEAGTSTRIEIPVGYIYSAAVNAEFTSLVVYNDNGVLRFESACVLGECPLPESTKIANNASDIFLWDEIVILNGNTGIQTAGITVSNNPSEVIELRGDNLFFVENNDIFQFNLATNQRSVIVNSPIDKGIDYLSAASDGSLIATWSEYGYPTPVITVWQEGEVLHELQYNFGDPNFDDYTFLEMYNATFSPDNRLLVAGGGDILFALGAPYRSLDNPIIIWEMETGEELVRLNHHQNRVRRVLFNEAGTLLITAGMDGTIRLWGVPQ